MSASGGAGGTTGGDVAGRLARLTGTGVRHLRPVGAQHRWRHYRAALADGREVFAKVAQAGPGGVFAAEGRGLRWLAEANAVNVPEALGWDDTALVVTWLAPGRADPAAAGWFGAGLARLHQAGAAGFGAPWPGYIATLPLPNDWRPAGVPGGPGEGAAGAGPGRPGADWLEWYAARRVMPYLRRALGQGSLSAPDAGLIEAALGHAGGLLGPPEPVSRLHGDCWSGNLMWSGGEGWLVDPAAHGGHRESDLAMLALFGAPYLDQIIAGYQEVAPLAAGWQARVPLHQLHPLLVHVCLFGGGYRDAAVGAARAVLAA